MSVSRVRLSMHMSAVQQVYRCVCVCAAVCVAHICRLHFACNKIARRTQRINSTSTSMSKEASRGRQSEAGRERGRQVSATFDICNDLAWLQVKRPIKA